MKTGAAKPDISTPDAFKRAMLAAKSIAYSRAGASGLYMAKLMERLGIGEEVKGKTKLVDGVPVAEVVAKGEAEIGMQQINVILPIIGIEYVGPLPPELQDYVVFAAAVLTASKQPEAAITMIRFMADPAVAPLIRKGNMEPLVRLCRQTLDDPDRLYRNPDAAFFLAWRLLARQKFEKVVGVLTPLPEPVAGQRERVPALLPVPLDGLEYRRAIMIHAYRHTRAGPPQPPAGSARGRWHAARADRRGP